MDTERLMSAPTNQEQMQAGLDRARALGCALVIAVMAIMCGLTMALAGLLR